MNNIYLNKYLIKIVNVALAFLLFATYVGCRKSPTDGVSLIINPNVVTNTVAINFTDAANTAVTPANLKISITGPDAAYVYENGGTKTFLVQNGQLIVGVGPGRSVSESNPVIFTINASANGYFPISQIISITGSKYTRVNRLSLINISNPPAGVKIIKKGIALVNGAIPAATNLKLFSAQTPAIGVYSSNQKPNVTVFDDSYTSISFPQGQTFHYYYASQFGYYTGTRNIPKIYIPQGTNNSTTYQRLVNYYDTLYTTDKYNSFKNEPLKSDSVYVFAWYYDSAAQYTVSNYSYAKYTPGPVKILTGQTIGEDKLLFTSAVTTHVLGGYLFMGPYNYDNNILLTVDPDTGFNWYASIVLDPAIINPITNAPIQPGDSIEAGIDAIHGKTLHTVIKQVAKSTGGTQLRAESQSPNVGYYYPAPFTSPYNISFNTAIPTYLKDLADWENLSILGLIQANNNNIATGYNDFPLYPNTGIINYKGMVAATTTITIYSQTRVNYWGDLQYNSQVGPTTYTFNVLSDVTVKLQPTVTYFISDSCTTSKKVFLANAWGFVDRSDYSHDGMAIIANGKWATNGQAHGEIYKSTIYYEYNDHGTITGGRVVHLDTINKLSFINKYIDQFGACSNF